MYIGQLFVKLQLTDQIYTEAVVYWQDMNLVLCRMRPNKENDTMIMYHGNITAFLSTTII